MQKKQDHITNRQMKRHRKITALLLALSLTLFPAALSGCGANAASGNGSGQSSAAVSEESSSSESSASQGSAAAEEGSAADSDSKNDTSAAAASAGSIIPKKAAAPKGFHLKNVPKYSGDPYVAVHNNKPYFGKSYLTRKAFELYSKLDSEGRCGTAFANVCEKIMPEGERESIGMVKPTGWHTVKYSTISGKYLYNRCHLIGYQLAGENANEKNLITGTRYMNIEGMEPFENMVADYVKETDHHILYRVTPIFKGSELVARGVLMEARSVEDDDIEFCVYCYNVQPGIKINYATGSSSKAGSSGSKNSSKPKKSNKKTYIINVNTGKFHLPSCSSVDRMSDANKKKVKSTRSSLIKQGYSPCQNCNP